MKFLEEALNELPTLSHGQFDNLKIEDYDSLPAVRVWVSRCGEGVTVEHCIDGTWETVERNGKEE